MGPRSTPLPRVRFPLLEPWPAGRIPTQAWLLQSRIAPAPSWHRCARPTRQGRHNHDRHHDRLSPSTRISRAKSTTEPTRRSADRPRVLSASRRVHDQMRGPWEDSRLNWRSRLESKPGLRRRVELAGHNHEQPAFPARGLSSVDSPLAARGKLSRAEDLSGEVRRTLTHFAAQRPLDLGDLDPLRSSRSLPGIEGMLPADPERGPAGEMLLDPERAADCGLG